MENRRPTFIDATVIDDLVARARVSPRRRLNLNLHTDLADPIQRLLNAGEPGTYVRAHRHAAERWEVFAVLRGQIDVLIFADDGAVTQRLALRAGGGLIEIPGGIWHGLAFMAPGSVAIEVKPGPYVARSDKEFARWAPREEDPAAAPCEKWLARAGIGERWIAI
jgi:cupin fold WbuC family metalloprotein